ncbi:MAG TPA: ABC transporter permease [Terriglobales bacterium]|nr:ABC transporter permease [Terriglobales bacterium]
MNSFFQDIRYTLRQMRRSPGFTAIAVITLALGIGANTGMFSVINSVLLHSLPFANPSRLMVVWKTMTNGAPNAFSTPEFLEWKEQGGLTGNMGAFSSIGKNLGSKDIPERINGGQINYDLLPTLGVQPATGRNFSRAEDTPGAAPVVLLSHALWTTRFKSRPILGQSVDLDGAPYTVIGVMPAGFHVLSNLELFWIPLKLESVNAQASARNIHWLFAFTRLPDGTTQKQAEAQMATIAGRFKAQDPNGEAALGVTFQSVSDFQNGTIKPVLLMLMGAVCFVLLIACSNVANLLLARGSVRRREISIRAALGAGQGRIIRQFLTESVLLSVAGGALGLGLAWATIEVLIAIHPSSIPSVEAIGINGSVLAYSAVLCGIVGILFGIAPAWEGSHSANGEALKEGVRGSSGSGKHRAALVIVETALASILLIGAGLSLKSLWRTESVDPGFNPQHVLTFRVAAPAQYSGARIPLFYQQVIERIKALPDVQSAVLVRNLPMSGTDPSLPIAIEGTPPPPSQIPIVTRLRIVGPQYFPGMQISLLSGREFGDGDTAAAPRVAIVSKSLAKLYWPGQDALGKRIKPQMPGGEWCTVIGVAADVRHWTADVTDVEPTAYYPYTQIPESFLPLTEGNMAIAVRSRGSSDPLSAIRAAVGEVDKTVPLFQVQTLEQMVSDAGSLRRFDMWLIGGFAGLALILAAIGIYGVMAYSVSQRTREIGIRIALGAQRQTVLRLVLRQGATLAIAGVLLGIAGALGLTQLMASLLFGVSARDWATFSIVPWIVLAMIMVGCYVPARRAAKVDPMVALREE